MERLHAEREQCVGDKHLSTELQQPRLTRSFTCWHIVRIWRNTDVASVQATPLPLKHPREKTTAATRQGLASSHPAAQQAAAAHA